MAKPKIMIVDDSPLILDVVGSALRAVGYEVVTRSVSIGTGAAILREQPALVLMDVSMPLVSGTEISESIRGRAGAQETIILLHSDCPQDELARLTAECGAHGFIRKTGDPRELRAEVAKWLVSRRPGRAREGGLLVAGNAETRALVSEIAGPTVEVRATDSGTEALRVICSRGAPYSVVIGTSIEDISVTLLWHRAVHLDPRWRRRIVVIDEGVPSLQLWPDEMVLWSRSEPVARLRYALELNREEG